MAGSSVSKSVACPQCGKLIDKSKIQDRSAGLFCDDCAAGMRATRSAKIERQCPACAGQIGEDDVVCSHCGYDYRIGYSPKAIAAQTAVSTAKRLCSKCGHDCTALPNAIRCPECGTGLSFSVSRKRYEEVALADPWRSRLLKQVMRALAATALAIGSYIAFMRVTGQMDLVPLGLAKMGVRYLSLCLVTGASMLMWLEVEMSFGEVLVKLLVVASCGYLAEQVFWDASNLFIAYPFVTVVLIGLVVKQLDLELADGAIVTMVNWPVVFLCLMAFPPQLRFK